MTLAAYGAWIFAIVLVWDVFITVALGSNRALMRLAPIVTWLIAFRARHVHWNGARPD